jgi:radical SAM superfamily enzyme YgiQ (UPF0313 family)
MIFMCSDRDGSRPDYSPTLLRDFADRVRDSDLIGISLMTNSHHRACALTQCLRGADVPAPIVWGGVHATVAPDECIEHADAVCVGEGEESMLQLAQAVEEHRSPLAVKGMWFRAGSRFGNRDEARNAPGDLVTQLDGLPSPDWELNTHWVARRQRLMPASPENLRGALNAFSIITARGCPYHCTYCNNKALRDVYGNTSDWVRMRSLDGVLREIEQRLASFPSIREIHFVDDLFFVHPVEEIEEFAERYGRTIGLPLLFQVSPNTVTERRVRAMCRVPIKRVLLGIQSASEDTLAHIYQRPMTPSRVAESMDILARYNLPIELHYIVNNPYEPDENVIETMRFIASHHRHAVKIHAFPLVFFPGTPLYDRARSDGRLKAQRGLAYDHDGKHATWLATQDYLNAWLRITLGLRNAGLSPRITHRIIDVATSRPMRLTLDRPWFGPIAFAAYWVGHKVVRNALIQPFVALARHAGRKRRRLATTPGCRGTPSEGHECAK